MTCFEVAKGCEITLFDRGDSVTQSGLRSDLNISAKYSTALCYFGGGGGGVGEGKRQRPCPEQQLGELSILTLSSSVSRGLEKRTLRGQNAIVLCLRNCLFRGTFTITLGR